MRKRSFHPWTIAVLALSTFWAAAPAQAQQSAEELAKKLANPVASMISAPLQNNFELNYKGAEIDGGFKWLMNVQPVIPITLSKDWNIISRTILPVVQQGNVYGTGTSQAGLGDTLQSLFFSPAAPSKKLGLIWGVGPAILIPTSTNDFLGAGKWAAGPTLVVLKQTGPWTVGLLVNQLWQVGGKETPEEPTLVNSMYLQPFVSRAYKGGFSWVFQTEFTRNWAASNSVGALNLTLAQVAKVLGQLVQFGFGPKYWYGNAPVRARWGLRVNLIFLWPK
jgi:hypothetical protein